MLITEKNKQKLLKQLSKTNRNKYVTMETPYWKQKVIRPKIGNFQPVLAYEIYNVVSNPDEHKTITGLNQLVEEGKVIRHIYKEWIWYQKI